MAEFYVGDNYVCISKFVLFDCLCGVVGEGVKRVEESLLHGNKRYCLYSTAKLNIQLKESVLFESVCTVYPVSELRTSASYLVDGDPQEKVILNFDPVSTKGT